METAKRSVIARVCGRGRDEWVGHKEFLGDDIFIILIVVMVSWTYTYVITHQSTHFCLFTCQLCLDKGVCFFKKIIYLFIFGCVGSSFLCEGFL